MKTYLRTLTSFLLLSQMLLSCGTNNEEKNEIQNQKNKQINPNGDSELALLMRDMYDEAERIKKQIKNNDPVKLTLDYEKILTAHATEPEKANSEQFKGFAKSYLQSIENIKLSSSQEKINHYNNMITNCIACHQMLCPGPLVRIKKLKP
jgi:thioredoxin-related protein